MNWTLKDAVDRLDVAVLGLRAELRRALRSPSPQQVREAVDATKTLSTQVKELAALVEQKE